MRRLNLKFLISLMIAVAIVVAGVLLLRKYNLRPTANVLLRQGNEAYAKNDLRSAVFHIQNYLRHFPDDNEQLARVALISVEIAQTPSAQREDVILADRLLERALRQDELRQRWDLRRKLVDIKIAEGLFDEARKNINILSEAGKSDPHLDFLYARCAIAGNYFDEAIVKLQTLIGFDSATKTFDSKLATAPDNIDAYRLLALIFREQKQMNRNADAVVDQMVANNAKSSIAHLQRSAYLVRYNVEGSSQQRRARLEEAKVELRKALEIDPDSVDVLIQNSVLATLEKDYDAARRHLEHAMKLREGDERIYLRLAALMFGQKQPKAALDYIEKGLAKLPKNQELLWTLHESQLRQKDIAGARKTLELMGDARMPPEKIALVHARITMAEQNWVGAARELEAVRPRLRPDSGLPTLTDLLLGQCYGMLRQPDRQLEAYLRALQLEPHRVEALRGKAVALTALGRLDEALEAYQKGLEPVIGSEAFLNDKELVTAYHHLVTLMVRRDPKFYLVQLQERIRQRMAKLGTGSVDTVLSQVNQLAREKKYDEAATLLERVIAENPPDLQIHLALVGIITDQKGVAAGLARLADAERILGDSLEIRRMRGELLLRQGSPDVKKQLAALELGIDKLSRNEQVELWTRLGTWYYRLGQVSRDDVRRCWQRALDLNPGNTTVMEWLFELARESGDNLAMLKARDDMERVFGRGSSQWYYAEATRLVAQVRERGPQPDGTALDEARELTFKAAKQRPDWQMLVRLQAEIADLSGDTDGAIRDYQRSLELGSPNPATVRRLIELQFNAGRIKDARATLQRLGQAAPGMEKIAMLVETLEGNPDKALEKIQQAVPESSKEPTDFLLKGQMLLRIRQNDLAEEAFRRAVQLGPQLPQAWLALVEYLVRARKPDEAERTIRDIQNELTDDQAPLVLGQSYALLGSHEQAEHFYLMALDARPDNLAVLRAVSAYYLATQQAVKAIPYLKTMVNAAPGVSRDNLPHVMWARRELATLIARTISYPQFRLAVWLVEANASSGTLEPVDMILLARLYTARGDAASLRVAQHLIEQVQEKRTLEFDERRLLAEVFYRTRRWEKCRSLLIQLAAEQPRNASVMVALASSLLTDGNAPEADLWVRKLRGSHPNLEDTVRLSARLAAQRNRPDEAVAIIEAALPKDPTSRDLGRLVVAAQLLEEFKIYEAAEAKFRKVATISPDGKVALAGFFARRGRADDAFALLKSDVAPRSLAQACQIGFAALRRLKHLGTPIPPQHRDQLLVWFDQAAQAQGGAPVEVFVQRANLLEMLGRLDEAEQIYSQLVNSTKVPLIQRAQVANNLAFLLALNGKKLPDARKFIDFAIQQLGPLTQLLDTRAMVSLAEGNPGKAIKDLTDATEFEGEPQLIFHLALAYQKADNRAAAGRLLRQARDDGLVSNALSAPEVQRLEVLDHWLESS